MEITEQPNQTPEQLFELPVPEEPRQRRVADAMVASGRPRNEILGELSVSEEDYLAWVRRGAFPARVAELARRWAEAQAPYVWLELLDLIRDGSVPAIRLYFSLWGAKAAFRAPEEARGPSPELESLRADVFGGE